VEVMVEVVMVGEGTAEAVVTAEVVVD